MFIARQLFHEFRPLFRMLEEPLTRPQFYAIPSRVSDPFNVFLTRPAIDVKEESDKYILDADLPGVRKENVEVRIGDNGRSVTIEGKVVERERPEAVQSPSSASASETSGMFLVSVAELVGLTSYIQDSQSINKVEETATNITTERPSSYTRNAVFSRTIWLPRPVDTQNVSAKLDHGVLTVTVNKSQDKESVVIPVE
jgi:HSP20 family molecular chaperone IbpA